MRQLLRLVRPVHTAASLPSARKSSKQVNVLVYAVGGGIAAGASFGGYTVFDQWKKGQHTIANQDTENTYLLADKPQFKPSRSIKYPLDPTGLTLTLYQYQTCPFCCKVRAMLDYFRISYNIVEVNPVLRTQLKWSENYKKVPILIVETPEGNILQLNDSSMIVSTLFSFLIAQNSTGKESSSSSTMDARGNNPILHISNCYPTTKYVDDKGAEQTEIMNKYFLMYEGDMQGRTKDDILDERKWRQWADTVYVHTLSPNIYRSLPEAVDSFRYFDKVGEWEKNFKSWERSLVITVGAAAMWMVGKKLQKRHNLKPDVRKSLYEESDYWMANIRKNKNGGPFMGGQKPNLGDLAVYGVLSSIEGCEAFRDLDANSTIVRDWYRKVQEQLGHGPSSL